MATGVLLLGIGRATRLLGHLAAHRQGLRRDHPAGRHDRHRRRRGRGRCEVRDASGVTDDALGAALAALTGEIEQVPSSVSAVKVDGVRSYARVRAGEQVELAARRVVVSRLEVLARRGDDVDVTCTVSSGTYVRALARDLGEALGRRRAPHRAAPHPGRAVRPRRRPGPRRARSRRGASTRPSCRWTPRSPRPSRAATSTPAEAVDLSHGRRLPPTGRPGPVGAFAPDGRCVALVEDRDGAARASVVFAPA